MKGKRIHGSSMADAILAWCTRRWALEAAFFNLSCNQATDIRTPSSPFRSHSESYISCSCYACSARSKTMAHCNCHDRNWHCTVETCFPLPKCKEILSVSRCPPQPSTYFCCSPKNAFLADHCVDQFICKRSFHILFASYARTVVHQSKMTCSFTGLPICP